MTKRGKGFCVHCGEWKEVEARRLCWSCHQNMGIREMYPIIPYKSRNLCRHGADGVPCRCSNAKTRNLDCIPKEWRILDAEGKTVCTIPVDKDGTLCGRHANVGDVPASEDPTWAFGRVCNSHLSQYRDGILEKRLGTPLFVQAPRGQTLEERVAYWLDPVNGFVKVVGGCHVWQRNRGSQRRKGGERKYLYAMVSTKAWMGDDSIIKEARGRATVTLHRLVWALKHGDIAVGNQIHHVCGEMACVNIEHLEEVSYQENGSEACRVRVLRKELGELRKRMRELEAA